MKIAVMPSWNADTGAAVHSKSLVDAWRKKEHEVTVFSFLRSEFKEYEFTGKDERFVVRCLGTAKKNLLDPRPILSSEFDLFLVENLRMFPVKELAKIFPLIAARSRTVHIFHENEMPKESWFYQFTWDKVVYFDKRQDFLTEVYPDAEYIPFPCFPVRRGDKQESRKRLGLPPDKKIIFVFCQRGYQPYLRYLSEGLENKAILLFVTYPNSEMLEVESPPSWMIVREEGALSEDRFDDYLFASDAVIFHKFQSRYYRVASSVIFKAIGAGCPIFLPQQSEFFRPFKDEAVYYSNSEELNKKLLALFKDDKKARRVAEAAEVFARMNSADRIADVYIELFTRILKEGR